MIEGTEHYSLSKEELAVLLSAGDAGNVVCFWDITVENEQTTMETEVSLLAGGLLVEEEGELSIEPVLAELIRPMLQPVAILQFTPAMEEYNPRLYYIGYLITMLERSGSGSCILTPLNRDTFCSSILESPALSFAEPGLRFPKVLPEEGADLRLEAPREELLQNGIFLLECLDAGGVRRSWLRGFHGSHGPMLELCGRTQQVLPMTKENLEGVLRRLWRSEEA